jgi:AAA15 family ATPase/GTPase
MLIQFSVGNFRSFKDQSILSLVSANRNARETEINRNNTFVVSSKLTLLKSVALYGANASGKSNLVNAIAFMRHFVISSAGDSQTGLSTGVEPFRLSTETDGKPSFFEIIFIADGTQYRYGFELDYAHVVSEWLFSVPATKEATLFTREEQNINVSPKYFKEGRGLEKKTRSNALFLSVSAQFNGEISSKILAWFQQLVVISGLEDQFYRVFTIKQLIDGKIKKEIIQLIKNLDMEIAGVEGKKLDQAQLQLLANMPDEVRNLFFSHPGQEYFSVRTKHPKWNAKGEEVGLVEFDMDMNESHGTQKAFYLAGPVLDVLQRGAVLVIDEMEARLHPLVTKELISLFNSETNNPHCAQLILTTHDTNLLSNKVFRRDQVWFVEKDRQSASHLYSLAEIKVNNNLIRNDASYEDDYLKGRYGAVPFMDNTEQIVIDGESRNARKK